MSTTITSNEAIHTLSHYWAGQAGNSKSSEYQDGVEVRRNLVLNPTFTNNTGSWSTTSNVTLTRDTTIAHTSGASGKVVVTPSAQAGVGRAIQLTTPVQGDTDYIVSVWVNVPSDLTSAYQIQVYDGSGPVSYGDDTIQFATAGWTQLSIPFRTAPSATTLYFNPMLTYDQGTGTDTFYLDDAMIETGVEVRPYFDGSTPSIYQQAQANPRVITGWTSGITTQHIVHPVLGRNYPDIALQPAGPRSGAFTAVFDNEADAADFFAMHSNVYVLHFSDTDTLSTEMDYVGNGSITVQQDPTSQWWLVSVDYLEVLP